MNEDFNQAEADQIAERLLKGAELDHQEQFDRQAQELEEVELSLEETIKILITKMDDAEARLDVIRIQKKEWTDKIITPEIHKEIADMDAELNPVIDIVQEEVTKIKAELKSLVISHGSSVKVDLGTAVRSVIYVKGRESWDTKKLNGYAIAHPELLVLKKVGDPTVRFK